MVAIQPYHFWGEEFPNALKKKKKGCDNFGPLQSLENSFLYSVKFISLQLPYTIFILSSHII